MQCPELIHTCRNCGYRYDRSDKSQSCSECGEDRRCTRDAVPGYNYCSSHGGPSPNRGFYGKGRPIVTGSSSKYPLTKLASKALEMRTDGRVLSNRQAIDIIDQRIVQLAGRIDLEEAPERMATLAKLWEEYKMLEKAGRSTEAILVRAQIDDAFEAATTDYLAWNQMMDVLDLRRKHIESEVRVLKDIKAILTAEDANELTAKLFAANISAIHSAEIGDDVKVKLIKRIEYEFRRIIGDLGPDDIPQPGTDVLSGSGETIIE